MNEQSDRRGERRCRCNDTLRFQFSNLGESFPAIIHDCGPGGLSFSTDRKLAVGTILFVRKGGCSSECDRQEGCTSGRSMAYATVKWCEGKTIGKDIEYRIGTRYLDEGYGY